MLIRRRVEASLLLASLTFGALSYLSSCKTRSMDSAGLRVVNGKIREHDFPAVIRIATRIDSTAFAECTATWVSDRTVLTAAHCVEGTANNPSKVSISSGVGKGLKALKVHNHPTYVPNQGDGRDIAVLEFQANSSNVYIPMSLEQAKVGDLLTIIGFGKFNHEDPRSGGIKRAGNNKVSAIDYQGRVDFNGLIRPNVAPSGQTADGVKQAPDGSGENVTNSQGDSGGPMIIKRRVVGVSSSVSKVASGQNQGHYESVRAKEIEPWLKKLAASGVYMIGFSAGTEGMEATDPTVSGNESPAPQPSTQPPTQQDPESEPQPLVPPPAPQPGPKPTPQPQPAPLLDCNQDYGTIRQGGQGICLNKSSSFCYRYSNGDVQYGLGYVSCSSSNSGGSNQNPTTPPSSATLDCNRDFTKIRSGGRGVCVNRSSGFCYQYYSGNVQYNAGRVRCP